MSQEIFHISESRTVRLAAPPSTAVVSCATASTACGPWHVSCPDAEGDSLSLPPSDRDMDLLTWIIVGLVAGVLASLVMGGTGYGIIGDIIIGIVGAFVGGWLFRSLGVTSPMGGLAGVIFVAFIGAMLLIFILRLIRGGRSRKV